MGTLSGRSCVEGSVASVRSVVCAHFVSGNFLQILSDLWQILTDLGRFVALVQSAGGGHVLQCSVQRSLLKAWKILKMVPKRHSARPGKRVVVEE